MENRDDAYKLGILWDHEKILDRIQKEMIIMQMIQIFIGVPT